MEASLQPGDQKAAVMQAMASLEGTCRLLPKTEKRAAKLEEVLNNQAFNVYVGRAISVGELRESMASEKLLRELLDNLQSLDLGLPLLTGFVTAMNKKLRRKRTVVLAAAYQFFTDFVRSKGTNLTGSPTSLPADPHARQQPPTQEPQPARLADTPPITITVYCHDEATFKSVSAAERTVKDGLKTRGLQHQTKLLLLDQTRWFFDQTIVVVEKLSSSTGSGRDQIRSRSRCPRRWSWIGSWVIALEKRKSVLVEEDKIAAELVAPYKVAEVKILKRPMEVNGATELRATLMERFLRYTSWLASPQKRTFRFVTKEKVEESLQRIKEDLIGVEKLTEDMEKSARKFSSLDYNIPHGVLLYGPPGTGKTMIVGLLCQHLDVQLAAEQLAAGDFNKPLVGDSERMVDHIGERASAVPWQLCALAIDEIDALAPARDANASGNKVDLLSKVLSLVGGNQDVSNLVLFGSTNRFEMMDDAFLRRVEEKFFVGKPSFEARREWIVWKMLEHGIPLGSLSVRKRTDDLVGLGVNLSKPSEVLKHKKLIPKECEEAIDKLVALTINFSNDGMKRLLRMLHEARDSHRIGKVIDEEETLDFLKRICISERIFLGAYFTTDIIESVRKRLPSFDTFDSPTLESLKRMLNRAYKDADSIARKQPIRPFAQRCTHRMLVASLEESKYQFGMQMASLGLMNPQQEISFARLQDIGDDQAQWFITQGDIDALQLNDGTELTDAERISLLRNPIARRNLDISPEAKQAADINGLTREMVRRIDFHNQDIALREDVLQDLLPGLVNNFLVYASEGFPLDMSIWALVKQTYDQRLQDFVDHCYGPWGMIIDVVSQWDGTVPENALQLLKKAYMTLVAESNDFIIVAAPILRQRALNRFRSRYTVAYHGIGRPDPLNTDEALYVLVKMAIRCQLECVYLIDGLTLCKHNCIDDTSALKYITVCMEEAQKYKSGMVIIDLDSVVNVSKSYSSLTEESMRLYHSTARLQGHGDADHEEEDSGLTFSYQVHRPGVLFNVLDQVMNVPRVDKLFWVVVLAKDPYLVALFKERFTQNEWPLNENEIKLVDEARNLNLERVCKHCDKRYKDRDNGWDSCRRHRAGAYLVCRVRNGQQEQTEFFNQGGLPRESDRQQELGITSQQR